MKQSYKLKFMGQTLTIKIQPYTSMTSPSFLGEFLHDDHEIHLVDTIPVKDRRATLAHELFHAFLAYSGYNQLLDTLNPALEEALCRGFEHSIGSMVYFPSKVEEWLSGD